MAEPTVRGAGVAGTPEHADGDQLPVRPPSYEKFREMEPAKFEDNARLEEVLQSDVRGKRKMRFVKFTNSFLGRSALQLS